jgi:hypothetical protein
LNPAEAENLIVNGDRFDASDRTYKERMTLLRNAHLIVYVCASQNETRKIDGPIKLGQSEYHHEFNSIHHVPVLMDKTILATFDATNTSTHRLLVLPNQNKDFVLFILENRDNSSKKFNSQKCLLELYVHKLNFYLKRQLKKARLAQNWANVPLVDTLPERYLDEFELEIEGAENEPVQN